MVMTIKNLFFAAFVLHLQLQVNGQFYSTSSASTGAEIIVPVGTEKSGDMITGSFYPRKEKSTIAFSSYGIQVSGKSQGGYMNNAEIPILHIISSQHAYSITSSFDPIIQNRYKEDANIRIESINVFPVNELTDGKKIPDKFAIGVTLQVGPQQAPGQYASNNPYRVTVHFN